MKSAQCFKMTIQEKEWWWNNSSNIIANWFWCWHKLWEHRQMWCLVHMNMNHVGLEEHTVRTSSLVSTYPFKSYNSLPQTRWHRWRVGGKTLSGSSWFCQIDLLLNYHCVPLWCVLSKQNDSSTHTFLMYSFFADYDIHFKFHEVLNWPWGFFAFWVFRFDII